MLAMDLEAGSIDSLSKLGPAAADARVQLSVKVCKKCEQVGWLTAESVTVIPEPTGPMDDDDAESEEGLENEESTVLVKNLVLWPEALEIVRAFKPPEEEPGEEDRQHPTLH